MMHFAIVEDLAMDQEHLIRLIQENFKKYNETADFDCYESGEDFLEHFRPGLYHAVFMDIMLNKAGLNGIETSEKLRSIAERIPLIFITSERDYSLQGYRVHPLDYLLKPIDADSLSWCLNEIRTFLAEPAYIEIQASLGQGQTSLKRIFLDDFLYAETQNHRLIIHTLKEDISARLSFAELLALLPKSGRFFQVDSPAFWHKAWFHKTEARFCLILRGFSSFLLFVHQFLNPRFCRLLSDFNPNLFLMCRLLC